MARSRSKLATILLAAAGVLLAVVRAAAAAPPTAEPQGASPVPPAATSHAAASPSPTTPTAAGASAAERAAALLAAAGEEAQSGNAAQAEQTLAAARQLYRQMNDQDGEANCLVLLAMVENVAGDARGSAAHFEESLPVLEKRGDFTAWMVVSMLGMLDFQQGRLPAALARHESALAMLQDFASSVRPFSLQSLRSLGTLLHLPTAPLEQLDSGMADLMKPLMLRFAECASRDAYAAVLAEAGRFAEAEAQLAKAAEISSLFGGILDSSIELHVGDLRRRQWRFAEAKVNYQKALARLDQAPGFGPLTDAAEKIRVLDQLAEIELLTGHTGDALAWNDKALEQARRSPDRRRQAGTLEARAEILMHANRTGEAEATLNEALASTQQGDAYRRASILGNLGTVAMLEGSYERAAAQLEKAGALFRQLDEPLLAGPNSVLLAEVYVLADSPASSAAALEDARKSAQQSGSRLVESMAGVIATEQRRELGKADQGAVRDKFKAMLALPEAEGLMLDAGARALLDQAMSPADGTPAALDTPADLTAASPAQLEWLSTALLGRVYLLRGDLPAARAAWQQSLLASRSLGNKDLTAMAAAALGAIAMREGQTDRAVEYFSQSVAFVEANAADLKGDELLTAYLGSDRRFFYGFLIEMLARQGKARLAFELAERARDRALLQLLGNRRLRLQHGDGAGLTAEVEALRLAVANWERQLEQPEAPRRASLLEDLRQARAHYQALLVRVKLLDPEYASLVAVAPLKVEEVQRALTPGTALVSYFVTPFAVHAWVIDEERCEHVTLALDRDDLRAALCFAGKVSRDARGAERTRTCGLAEAAPAEHFYSKLIAPLLPYIRHRRLVIVPHAELHYVPFAALRDPASGRYLIEDFTLANAPSASTLPLLHGKEHRVTGRAMIFGDPAVSDARLGPLPAAAREATAVGRLFGTAPLLGAAAKKSRLLDLAGRIDLLHIAAHGIFEPGAPLFSRIVLAPDGGRSGNLEVHEIFSDLDLSGVSLVVLSACQTALGERSGGDEIVGLTRAFLYAGAPAVVSTLWSIADEASATLMEEFYRRLLGGDPAAEALRQAQLTLRRSSRFADPFYWAGFTLTGDPQQRWAPNAEPVP